MTVDTRMTGQPRSQELAARPVAGAPRCRPPLILTDAHPVIATPRASPNSSSLCDNLTPRDHNHAFGSHPGASCAAFHAAHVDRRPDHFPHDAGTSGTT